MSASKDSTSSSTGTAGASQASTPTPAAQLKTQIKAVLAGFAPVHVVYLDDDSILLETYRYRLANLGYEVFATTSPLEASAYIKTHADHLGLIISDFQMPEMNGLEFRQSILELAPRVPFVILSGYIDTEMALKGLALKIAGFVDKTNADHLMELIVRDGLPRIEEIREDAELLKGFITESDDLVERAEELILSLDQNPRDMDLLNHFFGLVHTLKGASSFFEPKSMHLFAHRFEEVLKKLQRGDLFVDETVISQLLASIDLIKTLLGDFKTNEHRSFDAESAFKTIYEASAASSHKVDDLGEEKAGKAKAGGTAGVGQPSEIKVPVAMLDEFMHISGEMTVIRNMLNKCVRSIEKQYSGDKEISMLVELLEELHKVNVGVQSKISEMRKIPVRSVLKAIPRAVREVSVGLGKEVQLKIEGDELRIDTAIADVLTNSLLHIVKNSIDHGLESPADREATGKERLGTIEISSRLVNEHVIVEVKDNGRGLNVAAIREKLVRNGSHTLAEAEAMPLDRLYLMIFEAGFSTAQKVTDISGRGVGMSLVKSVVESIRGKIQIQSAVGAGSKFTLTLPVPRSVLITNCLFVKAGTDQFGILEEDVLRVMQLSSFQDPRIQLFEGGATLQIENELISVIDLHSVLIEGSSQLSSIKQACEEAFSLVIVQSTSSGQKLALRVDEILDVEDTVIKAMPFQINPQHLYQGATFLDDGSVGLILYTKGLIERLASAIPAAHSLPSEATVKKDFATEHVLLFESAGTNLGAILSTEVHRIEEFEPSLLRTPASHRGAASGGHLVPYRGRALTVVTLDELLPMRPKSPAQSSSPTAGMSSASSSVNSQSFDAANSFGLVQVIVTERNGRLFGIPVQRVLEITDLQIASSEIIEKGIRCRGFYNEKIVTVFDLDALLNLFLGSNNRRDESRTQKSAS